MSTLEKTLVMAGSREAHGVIAGLVGRGGQVVASLPESERSFDPLPVPTRVGPFASHGEFSNWLTQHSVSTVIDASHSFDTDLADLVCTVCRENKLRHLRILRPIWHETAGDQWKHVPSVRQAAENLPVDARAFSNTGWLTLPNYARFSGERLFMRQTHPTSKVPPYDFLRFVEGRPPFSQSQEEQLFERLRITHLICRNVGGAASKSKLLAARALELPVMMIARPANPPDGTIVETVAEALAWEAGG